MTATRRFVLFAAVCSTAAIFLGPTAEGGTIEEQRRRLPPPQECTDAAEGVWAALHYGEAWGEWYEYTLNIRRKAEGSDELVGDVISHYWNGRPDDPRPPACTPSGFEVVVRMPGAAGKIEGQKIDFGATRYEVQKEVCGAPHGYNPDHFSGVIDPALQEFQSVNNDGGKAVNDPVVFRRVKCFDPPRRDPKRNVSPPAYAPAKRTGCGR